MLHFIAFSQQDKGLKVLPIQNLGSGAQKIEVTQVFLSGLRV